MTGGRRALLRWLAASPLLAAQESSVIASPAEAINVMDFEAAARKVLPPAHFGYMATGVDDDVTLRANRSGFERFYLRPRRLIDVRTADLRTEIFGATWDFPIGLAPVGNQKAFHADGELPVARAARAKRATMMLSTATNTSVEDIARELGQAPWYQLYPTSRWELTERLVRRAEQAGCPVIALTVDTQAGRHTETFERSKKLDKRDCVACHGTRYEDFFRRKPMYAGFDIEGLRTSNPALNWDLLRKLRQFTKVKLLIKGIETREDAQLCRENGLDGLIVSNHGGRAGESGRGTIECLPEVIDGAAGLPVFIDGGFRRGTDIFKALALGARAVFVGRPYIWGSAAFGQAGVERVIDILRGELELVMKQCGVTSVAQIGRGAVGMRG
ncbi:MAG: alpha-hydroxy-acid oxidizing protein [Bryobacterales bacterium]|nr:alpha-hydroxy-acid oxidizing protein [Bryobacterales bacterium]